MMKQVYAVQSQEALDTYDAACRRMLPKLEEFLAYLKAEYQVSSLPRCIVWTDMETATHLISDIPIPAYINDYRTVFCPEPEVWRNLYLRQLDGQNCPEIQEYYERKLTENHVLQILGHEFVHHSDLFIDEAYERARWFEEGMCEYISRKYFLTEEQFSEEAGINALLVAHFCEKNEKHSLEDFSADTYTRDYASIFFEYWHSFLAVKQIVDRFGGDVMSVFREYHRWYREGNEAPLVQWLQVTI